MFFSLPRFTIYDLQIRSVVAFAQAAARFYFNIGIGLCLIFRKFY